MTRAGRGRLVFAAAFAVLLADGAAAIWLGQVSAHGLLVGVGLVLVAAAVGLAVVYRRWQDALAEVVAARLAMRREVEALRRALSRLEGPGPA